MKDDAIEIGDDLVNGNGGSSVDVPPSAVVVIVVRRERHGMWGEGKLAHPENRSVRMDWRRTLW
jgi:hypothetical protein